MSARTTAALALVIAGWTTVVGAASANDTLAQAKELYASAAYDEALAVLDRLQSSERRSAETTSITEYRVYCLLALDRRDEARKDIEGILHDNPQYLPSDAQASPRIQSVFRDVRRQALPKIVLERYAIAKASFERKDPQAGPQFDSVLTLLGRSRRPGVAGPERSADHCYGVSRSHESDGANAGGDGCTTARRRRFELAGAHPSRGSPAVGQPAHLHLFRSRCGAADRPYAAHSAVDSHSARHSGAGISRHAGTAD
jgi:tetratricopeptide (TPR) repeat protein